MCQALLVVRLLIVLVIRRKSIANAASVATTTETNLAMTLTD
jgi:hypothetical protein